MHAETLSVMTSWKDGHGIQVQSTAKQGASRNVGPRSSAFAAMCRWIPIGLPADQMVHAECFPLLELGASGCTDTCRCPLG
jgi:hypothetical protein